MKPDGTHTKEEIIEIIQNELQSWERDEICTALLDECSDNQLLDYFSKYTPDYISRITGYYVYEEEKEDIRDMDLWQIINESGFSLFDFFKYIIEEISSEKLSSWIDESKLDKTILLNKLDRDFITEYFATHFKVETVTKIKLIKED